MRDIRRMLEDLGEDPLSFERVYHGGNGEARPCFNLPKRESVILVSGYDVRLRARIIDRWQELEAKVANPLDVLNDPTALRGLLLSYNERVPELETPNCCGKRQSLS